MNAGNVALLCLGCIALVVFLMAVLSAGKFADMQAEHAMELRDMRDWWSSECERQSAAAFVAGQNAREVAS